MKISNKEKNLLLIVLAILIVFASYKFVYEKFKSETETLKISNGQLQTRRDSLQKLKDQEPQFLEDIEKFLVENEEIKAKYGTTKNFEDQILLVKAAEDKEKAFVPRLSITMPTAQDVKFPEITGVDASLVNLEDVPVVWEDTSGKVNEYSNPAGVVMLKQQLTFETQAAYSDMKDFINFFVEHEEVMSIENVALSFNPDTGELTGNYVVNAFSMRGNGKEYETPDVSGVKHGVSNLFGTYQAQ